MGRVREVILINHQLEHQQLLLKGFSKSLRLLDIIQNAKWNGPEWLQYQAGSSESIIQANSTVSENDEMLSILSSNKVRIFWYFVR